MIEKLNGKEKELAELLKKYEEYEVNIIGMILTLRHADDENKAIDEVYKYLNNPNTKKDRDSIIRYVYKVSGIKLPTKEEIKNNRGE